MKRYIFDEPSPAGQLLINLPEYNILRYINYVVDKSFDNTDAYNLYIENIYSNNKNEYDFMIIINDVSYRFAKGAYIRCYKLNELQN